MIWQDKISNFIINPITIYSYCALISVFATYYFIKTWKSIKEISEALDGAIEIVTENSSQESRIKIDFYNNFNEIDDKLREIPRLSYYWEEFTENLIHPPEDENNNIVLNSRFPCDYFDAQDLLDKQINLRLILSLPNILIGLGILGTFIGLTAGIYLASSGLASNNPELLTSALGKLLEGASLAFFTSITGIILSILFTLWKKHAVKKVISSTASFVKALDERLEYQTQEKLTYERVQRILQQQYKALNSFATDLAVSIGDNIKQQVGEPLNQRLNEFVSVIKDLDASQRSTLDKVSGEISGAVHDTVGSEVSALSDTLKSSNTMLQGMLKSMQDQQQNLEGGTLKITEQLQRSTIENNERMQQKMKDSIEEFSDSLTESTQTASQTFVDSASKFAGEISGAVHDTIGSEVSALSDTLKSSNTMLQGMLKSMQDQQQNLEGGTLKITEQLQRSTIENNERMQQKMKDSIEEFSDSLMESTQTASQTFVDSASKFSTEVVGVLSEFNHAVEAFKSASSVLNKTVEILPENSIAFDEAASSVKSASDELRITVNNLSNTNTSIRNAIAECSQIAEQAGETSAVIEELVEQIKGLLERASEYNENLKNIWKDYQSRFEGVDVSTKLMFEAINKGLNSYTGEIGKFSKDVDSMFAKGMDKMSGAILELSEAIEGFEEELRRE